MQFPLDRFSKATRLWCIHNRTFTVSVSKNEIGSDDSYCKIDRKTHFIGV